MSKSDSEAAEGCLAVISGMTATLVWFVYAAYPAFILTRMWSWFVTGPFSVSELAWTTAYGLYLMVKLTTSSFRREPDASGAVQILDPWIKLTAMAFWHSMALLAGFIVKSM